MKILYISFHAGTHSNFDGIVEKNGWDVTHMLPPHGYTIQNREIAKDIWNNTYKGLIETSDFTHIVVSDTIINIYPFIIAMNMNTCEKLNNIKFILHVTNYFDYGNNNDEYRNDLREFVIRENVRVFYADKFIEKYLKSKNINPKYGTYIPLSGMIGLKEHKVINFPNIYSPVTNATVYYEKKAPYQSTKKFFTTDKLPIFKHIAEKLQDKVDLLPALYGGVESLCNYYGIVYIPYHYSTISFHEFLAQGLMVLIPSTSFLKTLTNISMDLQLCECYNGPLSNLAIQFDSIDHLRNIIQSYEDNPTMAQETKETIRTSTAKHDAFINEEWYNYLVEPHGIDKYKPYVFPCGRYESFVLALKYLKNIRSPIIIELGTSRSYCHGYIELNKAKWDPHHPKLWDHGAGVFTYLFADAVPNGTLFTVDNSSAAMDACKFMTSNFTNIQYYCETSSEFLRRFKDFNQKAHLIYMDHGETFDGSSDIIHLNDAKYIIENDLLHHDGMIIIDDVNLAGHTNSKGKGNLSIPYFLNNGFQIIYEAYQVVLSKSIK